MNRKLLACTLAVVAATTTTALAETKSWTAIKGKTSPDTSIVLSLDIAALRGGAKEYDKVIGTLVSSEREVAAVFDMVKKDCAIDIKTAVADVSLAFSMGGKGIVSMTLAPGLDEAKLVACANKVLAKQKPGTVLSGKPGAITTYSISGQSGNLFVAWPSKDVLVISTEPDKKDLLEKHMTKGRALTGELASYATKANGGIAWGAVLTGQKDVKGAYGTLSLAGGMFKGIMHVFPGNPKMGEEILAQAKTELPKEAKKVKKDSKALAKLIAGLKFSGTPTDIAIEGSISSADVLSLVPVIGKLL